MESSQHPLALIQARYLLSGLKLAAFLSDADGCLVFFNDAAGRLVGRRFEETGPLDREKWNASFGPLDAAGTAMDSEGLPLTIALHEGRPAHGRYHVRLAGGVLTKVETSALPLVSQDGFAGAMVVFWPVSDPPSRDG
jgi:PAS domain-containing protein